MRRLCFMLAVLLVAATVGGVRTQPDVVVITATFEAMSPEQQTAIALAPSSMPPVQQTLLAEAPIGTPTPDPTRPFGAMAVGTGGQDYVIQPGDTLSGIADRLGVSVETLLASNTLADPNSLSVGQVLHLPDAPNQLTSDFKIMPDGKLVRGPGSPAFDIDAFIAQQPGFIRTATDLVDDQVLTAAQIVRRVSLEFSVDPRMLLAMLEFKARWLSNPSPTPEQQGYPIGIGDSEFGFSRSGLYKQLAWTADRLNDGYYSWKYRGLTTLEFKDGLRLQYAPTPNAGTVAVQYMLSQLNPYGIWQQEISPDGFFKTYSTLFGSPFAGVMEPLVPAGLQQPTLEFPFTAGETWFFTGGPHGGWGVGSAWAAIDFAPPDDPSTVTSGCYVSAFFATAVAPGLIARTDTGTAILDLDGDGDESTGWTILYLHMAAQDRVAQGTHVQVGDRIGRPSCEGGVSNATHLHIARRYNGEWIP